MHVVVVESPAKAKTIEKYLGKDYVVLASYGHVRDLPSKDGSVRPDENFAMTYEADPKSAKHLAAIAKEVKNADQLILATDPDREGEAISWHVLQALEEKNAVRNVDVKRVVFNEITKSAVLDAMQHPRGLDMDLINAQQARRALDYLVGFTLSPVLWRKLPGAKSAGRVQSVALRLICDRETEIEAFTAREYWTIEADFRTDKGDTIVSRLTHLGGKKLDKFDLANEKDALAAVDQIAAGKFKIADVATKPAKRNPQPPFTTSTLQQEASRKLGFSAKRTMQVAQRLYEGIDIGGETVGLITYMRTDGVQMANEAIEACRKAIGSNFGDDYVSAEPRVYKTKAKNAQEAHEAVRPTDFFRTPDSLSQYLSDEQRKLYDLIWKRAVASQMESARLERTTIDMADEADAIRFRATGSVVLFPGFLKLYEEGSDDRANGDDDDRRLPKVEAGTAVDATQVKPTQHFTDPPPRYSEASLVKRLEELGIGRPSTYASILSVLQDRGYVVLDKKRFTAEDKGRVVTAFLSAFFERYVQYDFTAQLEELLDDISAGKVSWLNVLQDFWEAFHLAVEDIADLRVSEVLEKLNELLAPHIFPDTGNGKDPRACPSCDDGRLSLKMGRFGAFIGCSNYPECRHTRKLGESANGEGDATDKGPKELGTDPESGLMITLRRGPYGHYVQLGEPEGKEKPKRASLPRGVEPDEMNFDLAVRLLSLPRLVGTHPETGKDILAGLGRYGPYLQHDGVYARLQSYQDALEVGLNHAVTLLAEAKSKGRRGPQVLKEMGPHPDDNEVIKLMDGRYGPYVAHGKIKASLPKDADPDKFTIEQAVTLIADKAAKSGKTKAKPKAKKAPAKKAAAKKSAAKKTTAKKTTKKSTAKSKAAGATDAGTA